MLEQIPKTNAIEDWQYVGGVIDIPDGYFVVRMDCDCAEPYIAISHKDFTDPFEEIIIPVPRSLAYFLSMHGFASKRARSMVFNDGVRRCQQTLRAAIGF